MNQSLVGLMEGIRRALRDDVLPELATDHARSQLAGVLDILGKLERMLVWSPDALRERLDAIESGCSAVVVCAAAAGHVAPPSPSSALPSRPKQADLEQALRSAEQWLVRLSDWLFDAKSALPADLCAELDALLRATLRDALVAEKRLVPRADFSSMTATSE